MCSYMVRSCSLPFIILAKTQSLNDAIKTCPTLSPLVITFPFQNWNREAKENSSAHSSSGDEGAGSDSGSTCAHSAGDPPLPPLADVVMCCHRSPLDWGVEGERQLQRMATRGGSRVYLEVQNFS